MNDTQIFQQIVGAMAEARAYRESVFTQQLAAKDAEIEQLKKQLELANQAAAVAAIPHQANGAVQPS
jgi:cyanate lyase